MLPSRTASCQLYWRQNALKGQEGVPLIHSCFSVALMAAEDAV